MLALKPDPPQSRAAPPRPHPAVVATLAVAFTAWPACAPEPAPAPARIAARAPSPLADQAITLLPRAAVRVFTARGEREDRAFVSADLATGRSYSIGTTRDGYLIGGVPLADAHGLAVRPISVRRRAIHGTRALIAALERAASHVARRWPGSMLYAGDLSAPVGGDLPNHVSHNSGRDADLAFYLRDASGAFADSPDMRVLGPDLRTAGGHHLDTARTWALVEALLRDPAVDVQYLFVADHIRDALIAHARGVGADETLIARGAAVMIEPRRGSPHAEHFHLRVYCGLDERLEGCLDGAPFHPWARRHDAEVARWVDGLVPFLTPAHGDEVRWAITRLVRMNAREALPALRALAATAADTETARLASDAAAFLSGARTPEAWRHWRPPDDLLED